MPDHPIPGDVLRLKVTVEEAESDEPCMFCSSYPEHEGLLMERGVIGADYQLTNVYGEVMGYTCEMCIEAAAIEERGNPPVEAKGVSDA